MGLEGHHAPAVDSMRYMYGPGGVTMHPNGSLGVI